MQSSPPPSPKNQKKGEFAEDLMEKDILFLTMAPEPSETLQKEPTSSKSHRRLIPFKPITLLAPPIISSILLVFLELSGVSLKALGIIIPSWARQFHPAS